MEGRTALVVSRFRDKRPDILILQNFEKNCLACGTWDSVAGPILFAPTKLSTRLYTTLHLLLRPLLERIRSQRVIVSLGLPYRHYLLGKTFPHFALHSPLRVLWTYDAWE